MTSKLSQLVLPPVPPEEKLTPLGNALAGAVGGVFSNGVVYPLDTVKTRIQADASAKKAVAAPEGEGEEEAARRRAHEGMWKGLVRLLKEEGLGGAYRGFGASMLNTFSMQFAYFYWYGVVRSAYISRKTRHLPPGSPAPVLSTAAELILGALAGDLAQIFTIPVSVIATRQQLESSDTAGSFFSVTKRIIDEDGITGLWRGLKPSLILSVNPAITYGVYERLKSAVLSGLLPGAGADGKMSPWANFVLGAFSKTIATVVTYPYIMAKVRIMAGQYEEEDDSSPPAASSASADSSYASIAAAPPSPSAPVVASSETPAPQASSRPKRKERYSGAVDVLVKVAKEKGVLGWYQGMSAQIIKAVLSQAILFVLKDIFERWTLLAIILSRRLRARARA